MKIGIRVKIIKLPVTSGLVGLVPGIVGRTGVVTRFDETTQYALVQLDYLAVGQPPEIWVSVADLEAGQLKCKYCGQIVPSPGRAEHWAGNHIKIRHRDKVHELAKKKTSGLPRGAWSNGLVFEAALLTRDPYK